MERPSGHSCADLWALKCVVEWELDALAFWGESTVVVAGSQPMEFLSPSASTNSFPGSTDPRLGKLSRLERLPLCLQMA